MSRSSYIYLAWIGTGELQDGIMEAAKAHINTVFGVPGRIWESSETPPDVLDPVRSQYSSTKILRWLLEHVPADAKKIIAVTDGDLFIPVLTFVFGEAQLGGKVAVVSTARLRQDFNGAAAPPRIFRGRFLTECVHELGHTFGLTHCSFSRCVMTRSNSVLDVDAKVAEFCPNCRGLLRELQRKEG
jgi:archaemetzincin